MLSVTIVLAALLVSVLAYRLARLPAAFRARDNVNSVTAQALTGSITPLAQQPAQTPWVIGVVGPTAVTPGLASNYYDPTKSTVQQTFNEFGFITSPMPAPVNPKTNAVPLTNADICAWVGHSIPTPPSTTCPRCGLAIA